MSWSFLYILISLFLYFILFFVSLRKYSYAHPTEPNYLRLPSAGRQEGAEVNPGIRQRQHIKRGPQINLFSLNNLYLWTPFDVLIIDWWQQAFISQFKIVFFLSPFSITYSKQLTHLKLFKLYFYILRDLDPYNVHKCRILHNTFQSLIAGIMQEMQGRQYRSV